MEPPHPSGGAGDRRVTAPVMGIWGTQGAGNWGLQRDRRDGEGVRGIGGAGTAGDPTGRGVPGVSPVGFDAPGGVGWVRSLEMRRFLGYRGSLQGRRCARGSLVLGEWLGGTHIPLSMLGERG